MDRGWNNDAVNMPSSYVESSVYLLKRSESTLQPLCYVNRNMVVISYIYIYIDLKIERYGTNFEKCAGIGLLGY